MAKLQMYQEIPMYADLYKHIRPNFKNLNNLDLSLLIWSFSKVLVWHFRNNKMRELEHPNFGIERSISNLSKIAEKNIKSLDRRNASMIRNSLVDYREHQNLCNKLQKILEEKYGQKKS